jgi:hypothetical protein
MRFWIWPAALCACVLSGCMVASGPQFSEAPTPDAGKALVYFYWPKAFAFAARTADIFIDGKKAGSLNAGGYTYVYLEPGRHQFAEYWETLLDIHASLADRPIGFSADIHAGETRYVRLSTSVGGNRIGWRIGEVAPSQGQGEIAEERYQAPD